jgi:adenosylcobinamide-GDP ribazoletransferase
MKKAMDSFIGAVGMFTRLPTPYAPLLSDSSGLLRCLPLVGGLVGLLWIGLYTLLERLAVSARLAGGLLCIFPLLITGFMHMDGFMDVTDALLSSRDAEKRRLILKDPNTGAFSVCALGCLLVMQTAACTELVHLGGRGIMLLWIPVFSRSLGALALICPPLLESSQLGRSFAGSATGLDKLWYTGFALLSGAALWIGGGPTVPLIAAAACGLALWAAVRGLGGTSGDVTGFCLTLTEAAALLLTAL